MLFRLLHQTCRKLQSQSWWESFSLRCAYIDTEKLKFPKICPHHCPGEGAVPTLHRLPVRVLLPHVAGQPVGRAGLVVAGHAPEGQVPGRHVPVHDRPGGAQAAAQLAPEHASLRPGPLLGLLLLLLAVRLVGLFVLGQLFPGVFGGGGGGGEYWVYKTKVETAWRGPTSKPLNMGPPRLLLSSLWLIVADCPTSWERKNYILKGIKRSFPCLGFSKNKPRFASQALKLCLPASYTVLHTIFRPLFLLFVWVSAHTHTHTHRTVLINNQDVWLATECREREGGGRGDEGGGGRVLETRWGGWGRRSGQIFLLGEEKTPSPPLYTHLPLLQPASFKSRRGSVLLISRIAEKLNDCREEKSERAHFLHTHIELAM